MSTPKDSDGTPVLPPGSRPPFNPYGTPNMNLMAAQYGRLCMQMPQGPQMSHATTDCSQEPPVYSANSNIRNLNSSNVSGYVVNPTPRTSSMPGQVGVPAQSRFPASSIRANYFDGGGILNVAKLTELAGGPLEEQAIKIIMTIADEFIDSVTTFACKLARHRKSDVLEPKDIQMHLERNWGIVLPGIGGGSSLPHSYMKKRPLESHKQRLQTVKRCKK
ncbi:transcription initiation factor TFIID subunit 12-like [Schistocerca gregaria]|uniref:transcription initiation factor TFIID subunit 12-like n=1 Tax=Schistocerca gregaria TaxID=7010 RepID=UPI00211E3CD2|nr:transcription initiation factor TFIID subunit 12-like [Schistocerca gregaria]